MEDKHIIEREIEDEMKQSYLDYAMSVIVGRALPDSRDGLKPVHRRVLYTMWDSGLLHNKPFRKCANVVGNCMAKYHPHGDSAIYDTLVRLAQDFSMRYPLVDGQGNFGSVDGDNAAAMRYCVTADTLMLTDKGIIPIGGISSKRETSISLRILSYNKKINKATKFFNSGKHKTLKVLTNTGYEIKGSLNHPLMCWTTKDHKPQLEWKTLNDIEPGDFLVLNRGSSIFSRSNLRLSGFKPKKNKKVALPSEMNGKLAFLLGALVSGGSFHQTRVIFNNPDISFYNYVKDIIYDQFRGIELCERKIAGNCMELGLYHQHAVEFLKNIGLTECRSDKKSIPFSVLRSTKQTIQSFLRGLFEGDGSVSYKTDKRHGGKSIELAYNSKSALLISQLKVLLLNFGIATAKPYVDKRSGCYRLIISGYGSIKAFRDNIGFFSDSKNTVLANIDCLNPSGMSKTDYIPFLSDYFRKKYRSSLISRLNFDSHYKLKDNYSKLIRIIDSSDKKLVDSIINSNYLFAEVGEIKPNGIEEVFSVKVDSNCHSFVANGFINHNTEARLTKLSEELLLDIDKETVDFIPNFDNSTEEPSILPAKFPNLLVNGSSGIAVGMATNIPPHNLPEIIDAALSIIDDPDIEVEDLMQHVKGPDFPTGGIICSKTGILSAYKIGRGKIIVRARIITEKLKGKDALIITEVPYMVNKASLVEQIANLVKDKKIIGISDIRDESDRDGIRIVLELGSSANPDVIINQLYAHTRAQTTFGINMLALDKNQPKTMGLKELIQHFIDHRIEVVTRRTKYELKQAEEREHIVRGLIIALDNIDAVISLIKKSPNAQEAKQQLISSYSLSDKQSQAILDMRLQRLTSLEQGKLRKEHEELLKRIAGLKSILADHQKILGIIKEELVEMKQKYGNARKTDIIDQDIIEIDLEELIDEEDMIITITHAGYIKRLPIAIYKSQNRGGKGIQGMRSKEEDYVKDIFIASTHAYMLFFTNRGKVHWLKVYNIPEGGRYAKGKAIINLLDLEQGEKVTAFVPVRNFKDGQHLVMATRKGIVKKTELMAYSRPRKGGIIAITLAEDDELIDVRRTQGDKEIILATSSGKAIRFKESDIRPTGRSAHGVIGIRLKDNDSVIAMVAASNNTTLLTITENGFGKRTRIDEYRLINRGGMGVTNILCTERNGRAVEVLTVTDNDEILIISKNGIVIRMPSSSISVIGRATQGVRVMRLVHGDKVVSAAKIIQEVDSPQ